MTVHPRPLTLLAGDVGLIVIFLQNQLVSYTDGSSSHDQSGLKRLDTRDPPNAPKERISGPACKGKSWSWATEHPGVVSGTNSPELGPYRLCSLRHTPKGC